MDVNSAIKNPIAASLIKKYLKKEKLHGVYVSLDDNGDIQLTEYIFNPQTEINNLKQQIYGH